jgi:DNA-binding CsgD family transcriptional regulator
MDADPKLDAWRSALQTSISTLQSFAHPSSTVFYRLDTDGQPADFELFGMPEAMHRAYIGRYRPLDPLHPSRCAAQPDPVVTLASQLPDAQRAACPYWTGFLRQHGVSDVVELLLRDAGVTVAAFSLLRSGAAARFTPAELAALGALQPLVETALLPHLRAVRGIQRIDCDARLTYREEQIARLVRDGCSNKEIARDLALGQPTVKTHLLRMFRKLGVSNRTELVGALFLAPGSANLR